MALNAWLRDLLVGLGQALEALALRLEYVGWLRTSFLVEDVGVAIANAVEDLRAHGCRPATARQAAAARRRREAEEG